MGLFSKEACAFCGKEVGMLKRTKMKTKDFICNDCKRKTNYFARMDYTTRDAAQAMMENLPVEAAEFEKSYDGAESRFDSAERSFKTWHIGSDTIHYRRNSRNGGFQLKTNSSTSYESVPVFWYDRVMPYQFSSADGPSFSRRSEMLDQNANPATLEVSKDSEGKLTGGTIKIPYDEETIREIRLKVDVDSEKNLATAQDFVDTFNDNRRNYIARSLSTQEQKAKMQVRNIGDTAAAAIKAAVKGEDVTEAVKSGIEMANDIEEGKVKRGLFGKLKRK